ncbi:MAG: NifB/NifX family molybdenum-iron cluster-binding protein [Candidatus Omnitrophica bacterium]|nr:NifB/NifX family molybdenum-iron cluster-binding protein [Candidatus Omnitrophota bacterium]MDD5487877.1 NifB/NifX family molybdenum-iron cluster-binding protein [Candidatus Omnitrophota bacterium]
MRICITAEKDSLDSRVDPRFGRCGYFLIFDTESGEKEFVENSDRDGTGGVGIRAGQYMAQQKVKAVLTGNVGPNAFQTLSASGIEVITGVSGTVEDAIGAYKAGRTKTSAGPSVEPHFGTQKEEGQ